MNSADRIHRFARFELDEDLRELRVDGRAVPLQPRVFDLLVYLARNRDRVVPKDELLESVWPGVIVTDASLQRAVSLARGALANAGSPDAIRTHARQGYRLCAEAATEGTSPAIDNGPAELRRARQAYARGDWEQAIAELRGIREADALSGPDLQLWAHAAQCVGRPEEAIQPLEKVVAAASARGDRRRAAWVASLIGQLRVEWREPVQAEGWYHRARRLLENEGPCRERGYVDLLGARIALQRDLETCLKLAESAREAGERFGDPDLEGLGLVNVGEASLYLGRIREGLAALDEAGVSVVASGLSPWAGGLVYCGVIFSCLTRADWHRAGQWSDQFSRWSADKGVAAYPGLCRLHRAEVLCVCGDLREAESECRATIQMLARQAPWAEGDAWLALGDILLARGDLKGAKEAYVRATELGWESQFGLALVRYAEGDAEAAAKLLARTLAEESWSARSKRGQVLAHLAIAAAAAGRLDEARRALAEIEQQPDLVSTPALRALVISAEAEVSAAAGDRATAVKLFRAALRLWREVSSPVRLAQIRCRIAEMLMAEGDAEAATMELEAAEAAFRQAGAEGMLQNCRKRRGALSPRRSGGSRARSS